MCNKPKVVMKKVFKMVTALTLVCGAFAFTGCTDYEEDINSINNRLDELEGGQIASINEQISSLSDAVDGANDLISSLDGTVDDLSESLSSLDGAVSGLGEDIDGLDARISAVEALKDDLATLEGTVKSIQESLGDYATKEYADATFATKEAVASLNEAIGTVKGDITALDEALDALTGRVAALEGKDAELDKAIAGVKTTAEAAKSAADKAQSTADQALSSANTALGKIKEVEESLALYAKAAELTALAERVTATEGDIDDIEGALDEKLNIAEFSTKFDESFSAALEKALAEGGKIDTAIAEAIKGAKEEYDTALEAVEARINALMNKVEDLAGRIQSLVFVPEYNDNMATAEFYTIGHYELSENQRVYATFQVTPKELAANVAAQSENVFLNVVTLKTRAAAAPIIVSGEDMVMSGDPETGYVTIDAPVPSEYAAEGGEVADYSIALYVADAKVVENAEVNADIESIDAGSYISSAYVQVRMDADSDLTDNFVLYNFTDKKEFENIEYNAEWVNAPDAKDFFAGYEVAVKVDDEYLSLSEATEKFQFDLEALAPISYKYGITYSDSSLEEDEVFSVKTDEKAGAEGQYVSIDVENPVVGLSIAMNEDADLKDYVGESVTVNTDFYYVIGKNREVSLSSLSSENTYEISNKTIEIALYEKVDGGFSKVFDNDWTYEFAEKHSVNAPYDQPIYYEETAVRSTDGSEISDQVVAYLAYMTEEYYKPELSSVTLNGEKIALEDAPGISVVKTAGVVDNIAELSFTDYHFTDEDQNYSYTLVYQYEYRDIILTVNLSLGALPGSVIGENEYGFVVDLGNVELPFTTDKHEVNLGDPVAEAYEMVASYFSGDKDAFESSLFEDAAVTKEVKRYADADDSKGEILDANHLQYTYLNPQGEKMTSGEGTFHLRLSQASLTSYDNEFEFKTTVNTWYGVNFVFTASAQITKPAYGLAYSGDYVKNGEAEISGKDVSGVYTIDNVDLSKYFRITGLDSGVSGDDLKVRYEILTEEDSELGIANVPTPTVETVSVDVKTAEIESTNLVWGEFTGRAILVAAHLELKGVELATLNVTLVTDRPIVSVAAKDVEVGRLTTQDATANLWSTLDIKGILDSKTNLVDNKAADLAAIFAKSKADVLYKAVVTFGDDITIQVGGETVTDYNPEKYDYDADKGTIIFYADDAVLQQPITFTVTATVTYYLDCQTVDAIDVPVNAVFKQK